MEENALEISSKENRVEPVNQLLRLGPHLAARLPEVVNDEFVEDLGRVGLAELKTARVRSKMRRDEEEARRSEV